MEIKQKGQSTLEFIMTFSLVFAFFFLFLKMAMNYTDGYYVHYATYVASRSYLTGDNDTASTDINTTDANAYVYAKAIFSKFKIDSFINGFDGELKANDPEQKFSVFTGLYTDYTTAFSMGIIGGSERVKMRSESFLGREPGRFEGYSQVCEAIKNVTGSTCDLHATLDDNGG